MSRRGAIPGARPRFSHTLEDLIVMVQRQGIDSASANENTDTTTATEHGMAGVAALLAQFTREMIPENVCDGLARRAEAARPNGHESYPRLGYAYPV